MKKADPSFNILDWTLRPPLVDQEFNMFFTNKFTTIFTQYSALSYSRVDGIDFKYILQAVCPELCQG